MNVMFSSITNALSIVSGRKMGVKVPFAARLLWQYNRVIAPEIPHCLFLPRQRSMADTSCQFYMVEISLCVDLFNSSEILKYTYASRQQLFYFCLFSQLRELIALDRQGAQQHRPKSPTVTPPGMRVTTRSLNTIKGAS